MTGMAYVPPKHNSTELTVRNTHALIGTLSYPVDSIAYDYAGSSPAETLCVLDEPQNPRSDTYRHPRLIYSITAGVRLLHATVGQINVDFHCGDWQTDNYLFDLDTPWDFVFDSTGAIKWIGNAIVRYYNTEAHRHRGTVMMVNVIQNFYTRDYIPKFTLSITPKLIYYADDPPVPPEPRWYTEMICRLVTNQFRTSRPVAKDGDDRFRREVDGDSELEERSVSGSSFELLDLEEL